MEKEATARLIINKLLEQAGWYLGGIHPSSIKKLRREGVLAGRDLKDTSGNTYWTVFLVSEN